MSWIMRCLFTLASGTSSRMLYYSLPIKKLLQHTSSSASNCACAEVVASLEQTRAHVLRSLSLCDAAAAANRKPTMRLMNKREGFMLALSLSLFLSLSLSFSLLLSFFLLASDTKCIENRFFWHGPREWNSGHLYSLYDILFLKIHNIRADSTP
jgi:hypothetical protein